jgi:twinkle protein
MHDTKGTSEINDMAENVFFVHKNKGKEKEASERNPDPEIMKQPDMLFGCEVQRNGDWAGTLPLWSERRSHQFVEREGARAYDYAPEWTG